MDDRLSQVESQVRDLERSLARLEQRLSALEAAPVGIAPAAAVEPPMAVGLGDAHLLEQGAGAVIPLVGRTFVALGGAYLLRALTDSAILPQRLGIVLGILYAVLWIAAADRDGGRRRTASAAFHALVGVLIAFPLVWEATARFRDLSPSGAALVLAAVTAFATAVAVRRGIQAIAWIVTVGAAPAAIAAIGATGAIAPFATYLIAVGVLTLWLGYSCNWIWLRWPAALAADVAVLGLTASGVSGTPSAPPAVIIAVQMLFLNSYLASIVVRTIFRARDVIAFEIVQSLAALAIGFGGAVYMAGRTAYGTQPLALINLAFGVGCYVVAFMFMRRGRPRNFHFYSALALVLVIASAALLLDRAALALSTAALAVAACWMAARVSRPTLAVHAIVYLVLAGSASGMLARAAASHAGGAGTAWVPFGPVATLVVAACALCWLTAPPISGAVPATFARMVAAVLSVFSASGAAIALAGWVFSAGPGFGADPGLIATVRTAVLALAAVALAWGGQRARFVEARWLFYPLLAAAGVKLLVEDLPRSKPHTLFVALAVYGLALIAAPRLGHRRPA